jgi:hypothetical protein
VLANWDPLTRPIITEFAGKDRFENVEEGNTVAKQVDEVTGLSTLVVIDAKRRGPSAKAIARPQVKMIDPTGEEVKIAGTDHAVTISFPVALWLTRSKNVRMSRRPRPLDRSMLFGSVGSGTVLMSNPGP